MVEPYDTSRVVQWLRRAAPIRDAVTLGVLNGAIGDRLEQDAPSLAIGLTCLVGEGRRAKPQSDDGAEACVFVHGLMGSEHDWSLWALGPGAIEYPPALTERRGATPVFVRYNSGLHISTNGRALAEQLETLLEDWPSLRRVSIVAHSMGGLVARSAVHYGTQAHHRWVGRLRRVVLLGVPSRGATLEQVAHAAATALGGTSVPWLRSVGLALGLRSAGIKDLRHGHLLDEDWQGVDPDEAAKPARPAAPPGVEWFIGAGVLGDAGGTLGRWIGDGAVGTRSAHADPEELRLFPGAQRRLFSGLSHRALLGHSDVLEQVLAWWPRQAEHQTP